MDTRELDIEKRWFRDARIDPEAFMQFYAKYYDRLFRLCYHRVLNRELAEDLVSETFLKAQRNLHRFRWQGLTMGAWLHRIALNELRYRLRNRPLTGTLDPDDARLAADGLDPLDEILLDESQRRVRRAIAGLDGPTREAFRLHYWDGLRVGEIAAVLGQPPGTVKARLSRGRGRVREILALQDDDEATRLADPAADDTP